MDTTTLIIAGKIIGILLMIGTVGVMVKIYREFKDWKQWILVLNIV